MAPGLSCSISTAKHGLMRLHAVQEVEAGNNAAGLKIAMPAVAALGAALFSGAFAM